jgi:hypothetical protein
MKYLILSVFFLICQFDNGHCQNNAKGTINPLLSIPFGTIATLEIEIIDGASLNNKRDEASYLLKVVKVNGEQLAKPVIINFKDETGQFPADDFELYKFKHKKEVASINSEESNKLQKGYVGRPFKIIAYESGGFTGIPNDYFKYQPVRQDMNFHFEHYLIIIGKT